MTAHGNNVVFRCLDCLRVWPERRTTRMVGPECAPFTGEAAVAVRAIYDANDVASLVGVTLQWTRHFTSADRVALEFPDGTCYFQDRDSVVRRVRTLRSDAHGSLAPREPMLIGDLANRQDVCPKCHLPDAASVAVVPVCLPGPGAVLRAYWRDGRTARIWHVQTMQLLAEAVGPRLDARLVSRSNVDDAHIGG